jgi:DNA-binding response OmpR family regulator
LQIPRVIVGLEDIEETRDGIERLLRRDGYRVSPARDEEEAVIRSRADPPDLILVGLAGSEAEIIATAKHVRARSQLDRKTPIIIFSVDMIEEGAEVTLADNVYIIRPDNFNQLRAFTKRVLEQSPQ